MGHRRDRSRDLRRAGGKTLEAGVVLIPGQSQRSGLHWETPPQPN